MHETSGTRVGIQVFIGFLRGKGEPPMNFTMETEKGGWFSNNNDARENKSGPHWVQRSSVVVSSGLHPPKCPFYSFARFLSLSSTSCATSGCQLARKQGTRVFRRREEDAWRRERPLSLNFSQLDIDWHVLRTELFLSALIESLRSFVLEIGRVLALDNN